MLNLLNLIPVWVLDGAGASEALTRWNGGDSGICVVLAVLLREWTYFLVAGERISGDEEGFSSGVWASNAGVFLRPCWFCWCVVSVPENGLI